MMDWLLERTLHEVSQGQVHALLPDETQAQIRALSPEELRGGALHSLTRPQPGDVSQAGRRLLNPCLAVQWLSAFEELNLPRNLRAYEPCPGSSEPVLLAMEIYSGGAGEYTALNLNRPLAEQLRPKLAKLRLKTNIIEDNAERANHYCPPNNVDVACFHHAINDLLQTAVSEPRGMDTQFIDWWQNERQMIEWLAEDERNGMLDERARPALISAVTRAVEMVKPGGFLLFDHWTWEAHSRMDWFPWELFCNLIPLAREWIMAENLPIRERALSGRDPQWWMCLEKPLTVGVTASLSPSVQHEWDRDSPAHNPEPDRS